MAQRVATGTGTWPKSTATFVQPDGELLRYEVIQPKVFEDCQPLTGLHGEEPYLYNVADRPRSKNGNTVVPFEWEIDPKWRGMNFGKRGGQARAEDEILDESRESMTIGVPSDDDLYSATPPRKGRIDVQAEDDLSIVQKVDQIPKLGRIKDRKAWVYELTLKGIPHRIFGSHIEKGKKYYRWRKRVSNSWKVVFEGEIKASRLTKEIQEEVDAYLISQHS